jgi:subtilisin-like proprotein convertase family protein
MKEYSVGAQMRITAWPLALAFFLLFSATSIHAGTLAGFNTANVNIPDPPGFQVSSPVVLSGAAAGSQVTSVDIYYEIRHPFSGDLKVWLTAFYNGAWHDFTLRNRTGGSADDIVESRNSLTFWNGASPNQTWYLVAQDLASGDTGYIDYFQIAVNYSTSQPDLMPNQPANWNNKIPIGISQLGLNDAHNYSGVYYDNQTLYFNWASLNQGNAAAGNSTVHVEVTGTGGNSWNTSIPSTAINQWYGLVLDQAVGPLTAGSHTFKVWVDYNNNVDEGSNEANNYYERTITVLASSKPDLTPYRPGNWNDRIPIGISQLGLNDAHNYSGPYYDNQTLYLNWASVNQGNAAAGGYTVYVEVTGMGGNIWNWAIASTAINQWFGSTLDLAVGRLAAGNHTFKVWVDYSNNVDEGSNEGNNYYERTITVLANSDDHGNSTGTATSVGITSTTSGRINSAGDNDYFRVQVGNSGRLTVYTTGSTDTYGYLLDSNGTQIASNDDTVGLNFQIERDVSPGTYYVRVRHYSSIGAGDYVLEVRFNSSVADDHGNSTGTATSVATTSTTSGRINTAGDNDYFRVQVGNSGRLTVYTTGSTDTYGYLLDSNGTQIASNDDTIGLNFQIERDVSPGTYYVRVRHYSSIGAGDYVIEVRFTGSPTDDHGNSTGAATSVGINSTAGGVINYAGDNDFFRVNVSEAGHLTVNTTGNTDTYGYLLDSSGNQIASNDDSGGPNFRIERDVTAGAYYVRVRHYSVTSTTGNYQLIISFTAVGSETHVVLLLHGMNSDEQTWDDLMWSRGIATILPGGIPIAVANYGIIYNGSLVGAGPAAPGNQATPDAQAVYYYAVRFGSKDNDGINDYGRMNDNTGSEDILASGPSQGDYSDFVQLGDEVRSAVIGIKAQHPSTNVKIVILAHSRGGVAARAFLQGNSTERNAVIGLVTLGTPHAGSRMGRIYEYLRSHYRDSLTIFDPARVDWAAADDIRLLTWILPGHSLDVRRPTIKFLADNSSQITSLNGGISQLPSGLAFGLVEFQGVRLGILHSLYDAFDYYPPPSGVARQFTLQARNYILEGEAIETFVGDGIVPLNSQRLHTLSGYPYGALPTNRRQTASGIVHIGETEQTARVESVLHNIANWWSN